MKHYWDDWVVETDLYGELDLSECALIKQAHGNKIIVRQDIDSGSVGDGIITTGESAAIYTADCLPLVLLTKQMALILHVSRKSLVCGLLEKAAEKIDGLPETDVAAYIGPHICRRHFEFAYLGEEAKRFTLKYPDSVYRQKGSWYFSLRRAVGGYLTGLGVSRVIEDGRCTYEETALASYRRSGCLKGKSVKQNITVVKRRF